MDKYETTHQLLYNITKNYKKTPLRLDANYIKMPVNLLKTTEANAKIYNELVDILQNSEYSKIVRTKSGGISISLKNFVPPMYDIQLSKYGAEIIIIDDYMYRIQFRAEIKNESGSTIGGHKAFLELTKELKKDNINIEDYIINNGEEIKKEIQKPYIEMADVTYSDLTFENVHHIDYHNSWPAGLTNIYPEFRPTIERLYNERKIKPENKNILNESIGYMQSKYCNYKYAHLSKAAINDNNDRIRELAKKISDSGRVIINYNTDGIWYYGDIYHGENEGTKLGEWENDHINCTFRMKSAGAYEYIENGKYKPVVRGTTTLEVTKPRSEWQWGDIYNGALVLFHFDKDTKKVEVRHNEEIR